MTMNSDLFPKKVYLGLGSNVGNSYTNLCSALNFIHQDPSNQVVKVSPLYKTPAWGEVDQPDFMNATAEVRTSLSPLALLRFCLDIEKRLLRIRTKKMGPRTIDIDLLFFDGLTINTNEIQIPHPLMLQRAFVLAPLADMDPDFVIGGEAISCALLRLASQKVYKISSLSLPIFDTKP